jgi:hypothetical protein
MIIRNYLDSIEDQIRHPITQKIPVDRWELLDILADEVRKLSGDFQWDWAATQLSPIIRTQTNKRRYLLPNSFGLNFARGAEDKGGETFTVTLSDGSNEVSLTYEEPSRFFARNLEAESDATPSVYTIETIPSGRRRIVLSPPPDSNSSSHYTINGLFVPTDWYFEHHDFMFPIPGNSDVLDHRILARVFEDRDDNRFQIHNREAGRSVGRLLLSQARGRRTRISPRKSKYATGNSYTLVRR